MNLFIIMASRISLKYFEHKNIIFCAQSRQANLVQSWSVCLVLAINETSLTIYIDYTLEQKKSSEYREQNSFHPKLTSRDKCKIRMYIFTSLCENTGKIGEMLFLPLPLVLPGRSASSPSPLNSRGTVTYFPVFFPKLCGNLIRHLFSNIKLLLE